MLSEHLQAFLDGLVGLSAGLACRLSEWQLGHKVPRGWEFPLVPQGLIDEGVVMLLDSELDGGREKIKIIKNGEM
jgi:hypothetical protein